ncbi:hypothetical protein C1645_882567, partial [Glomus cerebriforme]
MSSSSTSVVNYTYVGYDELDSYLKQRRNKSLLGFLTRYREVIVSSLTFSAISHWKDLDNTWSTRFLHEAKRIDRSNFARLEKKIKMERSRHEKDLESFWCDLVQECRIKQDISEHQAEKDRYLQIISNLEIQIQAESTDLSQLTKKWHLKKILLDNDDDYDERPYFFLDIPNFGEASGPSHNGQQQIPEDLGEADNNRYTDLGE